LFSSSGIEEEEEEDDTFSESFAIEEGIFEDTFPKRQDDYEVKVESNDRPSLVPDDWKPLQEELSRSKWEKKREVIDNLVEHARRKQAQRRLTIAERDAAHKAYQQRHFPRVLPRHGETQPSYGVKKMIEEELYKEIFDTDDDDITQDLLEDETASDSEGDEPVAQINYASSLRATPRNPRLALGDSTFDDVARKFQKQEQDIEENQCDSNSKDNDAESKVSFHFCLTRIGFAKYISVSAYFVVCMARTHSFQILLLLCLGPVFEKLTYCLVLTTIQSKMQLLVGKCYTPLSSIYGARTWCYPSQPFWCLSYESLW
jgi:hypothetical protein